MKKITNILFGSVFALALLLNSGNVYAQEDTDTLRNNISELRETHTELKAQVEAGELTAEEARATWKDLIEKARAEKEAFFKERSERIQAKYQEVLEKNPERAAIFKEHMDAAKERRENAVIKRAELQAKVEAGEITKQEARQQKIDFVKTQQATFKEVRNNIKEKREYLKSNRPNAGVVQPMDRLNIRTTQSERAVPVRPVTNTLTTQ